MPFELANTKKEVVENWDWILVQEYKTGENQATEALFKWFFFSRARVQKRFLSRICGVPAKGIVWQRLTLQRRGKKGMPDAVLHLADNSQLLFEVKAKPECGVSRAAQTASGETRV